MLTNEALDWLQQSLAYLAVQGAPEVNSVVGDASSRAYFRVHLGKRSFIFCLSSDVDSNKRFREVSAALEQVGVMAPLVFAFDDERGYMLMSDMGDTLLSDVYEMNVHRQPKAIIHRALTDLIRLAQIPDPLLTLTGSYDGALLARDFGLFEHWCLDQFLGLELSGEQQQVLVTLASLLAKGFECQPQVWVHRDFHCRNLMLTDDDVAMIDFQDMVKGPVCYDLISIVYDAYWQLPHDQQAALISDYYQQLMQSGILGDEVGVTLFQSWVAQTAMQRLLKILGIFCRLALRDGKQQYLSDLPLVIKHVDDVIAHNLDLWPEGVVELWNETIQPALKAKLVSETSH
ncbi:aminoglycoside phosphotransferase family protein [Litoribacillus peritrichatus]|uniref:Phosphotransferase n=1 Tax=Litoribacillus peritrichatus TaxID=718191 RepID=A0ABP7M1T2_9GAMM